MFSVSVDASQLTSLVRDLGRNFEAKVMTRAIDSAAKTTAKTVSNTASAMGLSKVGTSQAGGWTWNTLGRIPRAVKISRKWSKPGKVGKKVFITRAKTRLYSQRAAHANLTIGGFNQWVPTGKPGKGQVRRSKRNPVKAPRPIFALASLQAQSVFTKAATDALNRALKAANKHSGSPRALRRRSGF